MFSSLLQNQQAKPSPSPLQYPGAVGVSSALLQATAALAGPPHTPQRLAKNGKREAQGHNTHNPGGSPLVRDHPQSVTEPSGLFAHLPV